MATYFLTGKYSQSALSQMSSDRTKKAVSIIEKNGGKVKSMYAVLGDKDLVFIVDFPNSGAAVKSSISLSVMSGIAFQTNEAILIEEFDKLAKEI